MNIINKILIVIASIIGIFFFGKKKGQLEIKNEVIKNELEDIKETEKRREERSNVTNVSKRKFLQEQFKN